MKHFPLFYASLISLFIVPQLYASGNDRNSPLNKKGFFYDHVEVPGHHNKETQDLANDPHSIFNMSLRDSSTPIDPSPFDIHNKSNTPSDPFSTTQIHSLEQRGTEHLHEQTPNKLEPTKIIYIKAPSQQVAEAIKNKDLSFFRTPHKKEPYFGAHRDQLEIAVPYYMHHAKNKANNIRDLAINALEIMQTLKEDSDFDITINSAKNSTEPNHPLRSHTSTIMRAYNEDRFPEGTSFEKAAKPQVQLLLKQLKKQLHEFREKKQKASIEWLKARELLLTQYLTLSPDNDIYKKDLTRVQKAIEKHNAAELVKGKKEKMKTSYNDDLEEYLKRLEALLGVDSGDKKIQENIKIVTRTLKILRPIKVITERTRSLFVDDKISTNTQDARTVINNIIALAENIELAEEEDIRKIQQLVDHPLLQQNDIKTYSLTFYPQDLTPVLAANFEGGLDKLMRFQEACKKIHDHCKWLFYFPIPHQIDTKEIEKVLNNIKNGDFALDTEEKILDGCFPKNIPALYKERASVMAFVDQNHDIIAILRNLPHFISRLENILKKNDDIETIKTESAHIISILKRDLKGIDAFKFGDDAQKLQTRATEKAQEIRKLLDSYEAKINPISNTPKITDSETEDDSFDFSDTPPEEENTNSYFFALNNEQLLAFKQAIDPESDSMNQSGMKSLIETEIERRVAEDGFDTKVEQKKDAIVQTQKSQVDHTPIVDKDPHSGHIRTTGTPQITIEGAQPQQAEPQPSPTPQVAREKVPVKTSMGSIDEKTPHRLSQQSQSNEPKADEQFSMKKPENDLSALNKLTDLASKHPTKPVVAEKEIAKPEQQPVPGWGNYITSSIASFLRDVFNGFVSFFTTGFARI